jgi:hypothetical protein
LPATSIKRRRVFISYAPSDGSKIAKDLSELLRQQHCDVFDPNEIGRGQKWIPKIEQELYSCDVLLAVLTPASYRSELCRAEQLAGLDSGKRVIPVTGTANSDIPIHLFNKRHFTYPEQEAGLLAEIFAEEIVSVHVPERRSRLRVFLCHSASDKERVRHLYKKLKRNGYKPWLDEEELLPGQDWESEIRKAVRSSDIVLVCLSASSITKQGFVQKEIRIALDVADEKPDEIIYIIPLRLEVCSVPDKLQKWHWVDLFAPKGYAQLLRSLRIRAG